MTNIFGRGGHIDSYAAILVAYESLKQRYNKLDREKTALELKLRTLSTRHNRTGLLSTSFESSVKSHPSSGFVSRGSWPQQRSGSELPRSIDDPLFARGSSFSDASTCACVRCCGAQRECRCLTTPSERRQNENGVRNGVRNENGILRVGESAGGGSENEKLSRRTSGDDSVSSCIEREARLSDFPDNVVSEVLQPNLTSEVRVALESAEALTLQVLSLKEVIQRQNTILTELLRSNELHSKYELRNTASGSKANVNWKGGDFGLDVQVNRNSATAIAREIGETSERKDAGFRSDLEARLNAEILIAQETGDHPQALRIFKPSESATAVPLESESLERLELRARGHASSGAWIPVAAETNAASAETTHDLRGSTRAIPPSEFVLRSEFTMPALDLSRSDNAERPFFVTRSSDANVFLLISNQQQFIPPSNNFRLPNLGGTEPARFAARKDEISGIAIQESEECGSPNDNALVARQWYDRGHRMLDALGVSQPPDDEEMPTLTVLSTDTRVCPMCDQTFGIDTKQRDFERHVDDHFVPEDNIVERFEVV